MTGRLTQFQIQVLLYFLEAEKKKRTVTDAAKSLGRTKASVTRALDGLEKLGYAERIEARKTALTPSGISLAEKYRQQLQVMERYMQYQDLSPAQGKENALKMLAADFSDEFLQRLKEQEEQMQIKEAFAGRQNFSGAELCMHLKDGSYFVPFVIYREHVKDGNNISMGNNGFEHPCELVVKDHKGIVYLTIKTVCAASAQNGQLMEGRIQKLQYKMDGIFYDAGRDGRYMYFPASEIRFMAMGTGRESILHGSICLNMQCSVGSLHMPESNAVFTMLIA